MSEHEEQVGFFAWVDANLLYNKNPAIKKAMGLCWANPNGGKRPKKKNQNGMWYSVTAQKLQKEGLRVGVPDITIDIGTNKYNGLRIEMKYRKTPLSAPLMLQHRADEYITDLSPEQKKKRELLIEAGYKYKICYTTQEAIRATINYLPFEEKDYIGV